MKPLADLVLTNLVPRLFLGLLLLGLAVETVIPLSRSWLPEDAGSRLFIFALVDGTVVGLLSYLGPLLRMNAQARPSPERSIVGFTAGLLAPLVLAPTLGLLTLGVVLLLSGLNVKRFSVCIRELLRPDALPDWNDARTLVTIHINLLATYTIVNAVLAVHSGEGKVLNSAFNFARGSELIVDALYFSIVLMTTVGFGDVTPQSPLAKFLVSVECLLSYSMLALTIGVITRGIANRR